MVGGLQDPPKRPYPAGKPVPPRDPEDYTIGIICALELEEVAVRATLDEVYNETRIGSQGRYFYTVGRIGAHNVVLAYLRGQLTVTTAFMDMMDSFPIKFGLMVGVGGGVPNERMDIRLGDVMVSQPDGVHGGVVHLKYMEDGLFQSEWVLNKPPQPLLGAVLSLKIHDGQQWDNLSATLEAMFAKTPQMRDQFGHQGRENDELFEASYKHVDGKTCAKCDRSRLVRDRRSRRADGPKVHYGKIATSFMPVWNGTTRDRIAREEGIRCFEMEAVGFMETFPCVMIRGVCDYADSHGNERWKGYAAATAAAFARELILCTPAADGATYATTSALDSGKQNTQTRPRRIPARYAYPVAETSAVHYTLDGIDEPQTPSAPGGPSLSLPSAKKLTRAQCIKPCYVMVMFGLLSIGGSLAVGLFYSIAQDRMGDGFTTAGWMVAVSTLILAAPMMKHYPNCRCWDSHGYAVL